VESWLRPGDRLTIWVYSTTFVQYLYISCYLSENKPVLSYLLMCLLPQWWPWSGCTLSWWTVLLYTHPHTHTSAAISASRSLFRLRKWFYFQILQCTLHRLQLSQHFSLAISLRNHQLFPNSVFLLEVSRELPQRSILNMLPIASIFCCYFVQFPALAAGQSEHIHIL
jgi:hypothetical protein